MFFLKQLIKLLLITQMASLAVISVSSAEELSTPTGAIGTTSTDDTERGIKKRREPLADEEQELIVEPSPAADEPVLPKLMPPTGTAEQLSLVQSIAVNQVVLDGLTVFNRQQLDSLLKSVEGKTVTFKELNNLRHQLSDLYLSRGYINSGVIIPDQKIDDGKVTFKVIEGSLTSIEVEGNRQLNNAYIENAIRGVVRKPLNVNQLSEAIKLLNNDRLVDQVNARLLPGENLGESTLRVTVKEADAFYYGFGIDNYISPSIGSERATLNIGHANLLGNADQLDANIEVTEGLTGGRISYNTPMGASGLSFAVFGDFREYIVVEEPFDQIDIDSESYSYGFSVIQPITKRLNTSIDMIYGFEVKHSESTLLGQPFSFGLGDINGESDVSVLNLSLGYLDRSANSVLAFQGTFRVGLDMFDATSNEGNLPDGEFTSLKGNLQYAQRMKFADSQWLFRSGFQLTSDTLLSLEKYAVGGRYTVRGYRENQFVRDNGVNITFEWRVPLMTTKDNLPTLQLVPFLDAGSSWDSDEDLSKTSKETISSVGLGLLWNPDENWTAELFYGHALDDLPESTEDNLQDDGIHLQVMYKSLQ